MSNAVSADSIKAQMPHAILTRVLGEPTHKQVKIVIRELTTNLMAISCPLGHNKGHLGLLQDPTIYLARNGAAFTIPAAEPPTYPVIPVGTNVQQREDLQAINIAARKAWATYRLVLAITRDQFAAAINDVYYATLNDPTEGLNSVNLRTLVQHILTTYAQISQPDLDNNMAEFNIGIDSGLPLAVYTRKQENCQVFAACRQRRSPYLRRAHGHHQIQAHDRQPQHDAQLERVEAPPSNSAHMGKLETPLDGSDRRNA
jgi:hypothetical protein